jgi:hypothetical protein
MPREYIPVKVEESRCICELATIGRRNKEAHQQCGVLKGAGNEAGREAVDPK